MVTPQDKAGAVPTLLANAKTGFPGSNLVGYQSANWPSGSYTLSSGQYTDEVFRLLDGESPSVLIDSVTAAGLSSTSFTVFIMDDANFQAWLSGSSSATACAVNAAPTAGSTIVCQTPPAGAYHIVYLNPSSNILDRTVTRRRPMTEWEVTYYQTKAIFQQLRSQGLTYVALTGTGFFATSQNVRYPAESLAQNGANCIDGSLVFASALEAMGMEPILALDMTHGHAFAAVRCWSGSNCVIPIETTMVGGTKTFDDAVGVAGGNWSAWTSDASLEQIDIAAARAAGVTPAPM
jgi:hypothetical protein